MDDRKTKLNCWEFKKCGRQPQGAKVKEMGLCPATVQQELDDVHEGTNAGRACWVVGGTFVKDQKKLGRRLSEAVEQHGYRQSELARHVGVHYSTISRWLREHENARRKT